MADLTVSSAVDTFMQASTVAAMRTALDLDTNYVKLSGTQTISGAKTFSNDVTITGSSLLMEGNDIYLDSSQFLQIHEDSSGNIELTGGALKASYGADFQGQYVYFDSSASDYIYSSSGTMQIYAGASGLELYGSYGLYMPFLPTSDPAVADQVYQDSSGHLRISAG